MQIKSILAGAAIALAASVGSAYAADQFATLDGVQAQPMNTAEMDGVRGQNISVGANCTGGTCQPPEAGVTFVDMAAPGPAPFDDIHIDVAEHSQPQLVPRN